MRVKAVILVRPRSGVLDPAGEAVLASLRNLGYGEVKACHIGRRVELVLQATGLEQARAQAKEMAGRLLVNEVLEDHTIEVEVIEA